MKDSTKTKFDLIGTYFVDIIYNKLYKTAVFNFQDGQYNDLNQSYANLLYAYNDYVDDNEFFKSMVKGIHMQCISTTNMTKLTSQECINIMVQELVPDKIFTELSVKEINMIFHSVVKECIGKFINEVLNRYLKLIINDHSNPLNVETLQNIFLDIMTFYKDKTFSNFLNVESDPIEENYNELKHENMRLKNEINLLIEKNNKLELEAKKNKMVAKKFATELARLQVKKPSALASVSTSSPVITPASVSTSSPKIMEPLKEPLKVDDDLNDILVNFNVDETINENKSNDVYELLDLTDL